MQEETVIIYPRIVIKTEEVEDEIMATIETHVVIALESDVEKTLELRSDCGCIDDLDDETIQTLIDQCEQLAKDSSVQFDNELPEEVAVPDGDDGE